MRWLGWPLLVAVVLVAVSLPAWAAKDGERYTDWTVKCQQRDGGERCILFQLLKDKEDKPMLLAEVGYLPENNLAAAVFTVPLGVFLRPGLGLKIDGGEPIWIPYERCTPLGCIAAAPLEQPMEDQQKLVDRFKRGAKLEIIVFDNKGPVAVPEPISLNGFTKGFSALQQ